MKLYPILFEPNRHSVVWNVIQKVMTGNIVIDGRNIYERQELEDQGFVYTKDRRGVRLLPILQKRN